MISLNKLNGIGLDSLRHVPDRMAPRNADLETVEEAQVAARSAT